MITVHLPADLARSFRTNPVIMLEADTTGDLVDALDARYPGMATWLTEANGLFRQHLSIFVSGRRLPVGEGAAVPLAEGTDVWILEAISGG